MIMQLNVIQCLLRADGINRRRFSVVFRMQFLLLIYLYNNNNNNNNNKDL